MDKMKKDVSRLTKRDLVKAIELLDASIKVLFT